MAAPSIRTIASSFPIEGDPQRRTGGRGDLPRLARARVTGDPSGVFKLAAPLMRKMVERSVRGDYRRLKAHLEG
jgi:hypothetical protein